MGDDKPFFRFHPRAYERSFKPSEAPCAVCQKPCVWQYTGSIYLAKPPETVCARCISTGRLGDVAPNLIGLHDTEISGAGPGVAEEVKKRTPGFDTYNPFDWPVIAGEPLAFIGYGDEPEVWKDAGAQAAINAMFAEAGWDDTEGPSSYALVFRSLQTGGFVAVMDLD